MSYTHIHAHPVLIRLTPTQVAELTAGSWRANAEADVLHQRMRTMCWDDMQQPGLRVTALDTPHFVYNYPLKRQDATQVRLG